MSAPAADTRILVVEDEEAILRGLCDALRFRGYEADGVTNGEDGLDRALSRDYAVVLLDVMLPGMSGFDVCEQLRAKRPAQAIVILTARSSEADVLEGFRRGGDDYVTKPFSVEQLLARVDALVRRARIADGPTDEGFAFAGWAIDPTHRTATRDRRRVELTERELALLTFFAREPGRIVSRRLLLREVWGMAGADHVETRTVDMHIAKLRKKLGSGVGDGAIQTVRGDGYRYVG